MVRRSGLLIFSLRLVRVSRVRLGVLLGMSWWVRGIMLRFLGIRLRVGRIFLGLERGIDEAKG